MTGPRCFVPSTEAMTKEAFLGWLRNWYPMPEEYREHIKLHGKPRVRVPVERQLPNEADL